MRALYVAACVLLTVTCSQYLPNVTDIAYSAKLFDQILNSTDYDPRMRPTPSGINESVEVSISFCYVYFICSTRLKTVCMSIFWAILMLKEWLLMFIFSSGKGE